MYSIRAISLDYELSLATIVTNEGEISVSRIANTPTTSSVTRSIFLPHESKMEIQAAGRTFTMILGSAQQRAAGAAIYLDQNQWIDFARWSKDPSTLSTLKCRFFETVARAVTADQAILPLSSAHLTETAKRGGTTRIELASTMLRYSRGWQVRSVLGLRRAELRALFGSSSPLTRDDVITLSPRAIFDMTPGESFEQEFGPEISGLIQRQVWATTLVRLMIDKEPSGAPGREKAASWAQSFGPLAAAMRGNPKAKTRSRDLTRTRFFSDLGTDLPAAAKESGCTPERFSHWLQHDAESAIATSPGLARMREIMHLRLSNSDDRWEANDLNDWMHLSYAGAYCDLVLGERKTINYLRRSETRVPPGATLHHRACDAIASLELLLAS